MLQTDQTYHARQLNLTYTEAQQLRIAKGGRLDFSTESEYAFAFVEQHQVAVTLSTDYKHAERSVLGGELVMVPAFCRCKLDNTANSAVTIIWIRFKLEAVHKRLAPGKSRSFLDQLFKQTGVHPCLLPQARSWTVEFLSKQQLDNTAFFLKLQSHLYALAASYLESVQKPVEAEDGIAAFASQARQWMQQKYNLPMDIEALAKSSGASPSRFYTVFKEHTGLSPHKYMTNIRMNASLRLLANAPSSIVEVAHAVGYPDEYYFSRLFKKHMGMTPSAYTSCARKKVANLNGVFAGDLAVLGITPHLSFERGWQAQPETVLEQLALAEPDYILVGPLDEGLHQKLLQVAPVTILRWKEYSWKKRLTDISELLGLSTVAERWLFYYDMKVENARRHVKHVLDKQPFLVVQIFQEGFYIFGTKIRKLRDIFYEDLQLIPPSPARQISIMKVDTLKEIAELGCENVLFLVPSSIPEAYCAQLEQQWRLLKPSRFRKCCLFIRHYDTPVYTALVNESLVEQMVHQLLSSTD